ncbi:hypothetical protein O6H91_09G022200 [Diphasiastrum complanatum]|uniref:Uncharacterized protein n=1 Tax=Diphasiastrum complanatum TaxID=34168 RepID=A0ACC2CLZ1_DIPCM|nr:hypothetical protein O6H91_09G022200 [Diphasiastrum complanatum]
MESLRSAVLPVCCALHAENRPARLVCGQKTLSATIYNNFFSYSSVSVVCLSPMWPYNLPTDYVGPLTTCPQLCPRWLQKEKQALNLSAASQPSSLFLCLC